MSISMSLNVMGGISARFASEYQELTLSLDVGETVDSTLGGFRLHIPNSLVKRFEAMVLF